MAEPTGRDLTAVYRALVVLVLIVLTQAAVLARVRVLGVTPNLLLTAVVSWSLLRGFTQGITWGFLGGLGADLVAGMPLGTTSLALMTTCFLAGLGKSNLFAGGWVLPVVLVALATPLYAGLVLLMGQLRGLNVDWLGAATRVVAPETLLNCLLVVPVYPLLRGLAGRSGR